MNEKSAGGPGHAPRGRVITFYSFKGGTGRTMALANVAWILASNGHRVLVADWDLESPGLHRFFQPFLRAAEVREASGIIDLIRNYERAADKVPEQKRIARLIPELSRVQHHALSLNWIFPGSGSLDFLSPGRQNRDYAATLSSLDWDNFYGGLNGSEFLAAVRADMKQHYDYVLIDSRTGHSDIADICTVELPDVLVDCFTLSTQGIEGAAEVARTIGERYTDREILVLPVPMRVDPAEKEKVDVGRKVAMQLFGDLPAGLTEKARQEYWAAVEVPYQAYYAFEETLAVFGDRPGAPASMLSAFERLAARVTDGKVTQMPPMDEQQRTRTVDLFTRRPPRAADEVIVEFAAEDQLWAEWIAGILRGIGTRAREQSFEQPGEPETRDITARRIIIISAAAERHRPKISPPARQDLALYLTGSHQLPEFSRAASIFIGGMPEHEAAEQLLAHLGVAARPAADREHPAGTRYPGKDPEIDRAPARNVRFTGRENDLRQLREQLRHHGEAVVLPVTLQGLGGVGKTQIALEYVHRFNNDYFLVWWLECGMPQFIDASLIDLGARLQDTFGVGGPVATNVEETARSVLRSLEEGRSERRWLLVYDNAEEIESVWPYLPLSGGHVIITSRNRAWLEKFQDRLLPVEVFTREESVAHLRQRVPTMTVEEAKQVADVLGDLPLAVALAGAWLSETGYDVSGYLLELQRQGPQALSYSSLAEYPEPLSRAWDLSLNRLEERSPAAARLFQLCSVMNPRIALELLYSPAMARVLKPLDPTLSEPLVIGKVVRELDRLALIKLDTTEGRVHVHRLVQAVVRDRMSADEIDSARSDVQQVLAAARPNGSVDDPGTWERFRLIWPHLAPSQAMTSPDEAVRQLSVDRVRYMWQRDDPARGREVARRVEDAWQDMLAGSEDATLRRQLLHLRFNLGNILRDLARFEEARALDEDVLAQQRALLEPDHPHTLMTAGSLAADLRVLGRYEEALKSDQITHRAWTELYGEDHPRTLSAAHNLAESYRLTAAVPEALRLDTDTLERRRATLGAFHPRTLDSSFSMARDLLEAGRYDEAVAVMENVRQSCLDPAGPGAGSVNELNARVLLGIALRSTGRPREAEPHFDEASSGLTRRLGSSSSAALSCRLSHAANQLSLQQAAAAEPELRQVLASYAERLGASHPHTLIAQLNLAEALRMLQQHAGALQVARAAATGLTEVLGGDHPYTLAALMSVGVLLADQEDLQEAEAVEQQASERLERALGAAHPDVLRSQANLTLTRMEMGASGAEAARKEVIDQLELLIGADHPQIAALRQERRLMRTLDPQPF
jgi:MinD-like ATPase involved in chromosome partitioning or flagellar assembly/tetratricopeptide (TPR) repeat protein